MKVFGKALFEKKVTPKLYDFAQHGILRMGETYGMEYAQPVAVYAVGPGETAPGQKAKKEKPKKQPPVKTPKDVYELKTLNIPEFAIKCDIDYLDDEIATLTGKLKLFGTTPKAPKGRRNTGIIDQIGFSENGAVSYGRQEVTSMIERLENRRKFMLFGTSYEEWPYTTNDAIRNVLNDHKNLEAVVATPMLPDLPKEAVKAMEAYNKATDELCGKLPVYYLIRERVEASSVARKRDPILLAQSPFGFFWQILGAWDKEVVLLDEL